MLTIDEIREAVLRLVIKYNVNNVVTTPLVKPEMLNIREVENIYERA